MGYDSAILYPFLYPLRKLGPV